MSLQALKLTKENLPTIARTIGVNPETLTLLAANRDRYVLFETWTIGNDRTWSLIGETRFKSDFEFVEPESNRFIDVKYIK
jgi:hypothetical protein